MLNVLPVTDQLLVSLNASVLDLLVLREFCHKRKDIM